MYIRLITYIKNKIKIYVCAVMRAIGLAAAAAWHGAIPIR